MQSWLQKGGETVATTTISAHTIRYHAMMIQTQSFFSFQNGFISFSLSSLPHNFLGIQHGLLLLLLFIITWPPLLHYNIYTHTHTPSYSIYKRKKKSSFLMARPRGISARIYTRHDVPYISTFFFFSVEEKEEVPCDSSSSLLFDFHISRFTWRALLSVWFMVHTHNTYEWWLYRRNHQVCNTLRSRRKKREAYK